MCKVKCTHEYLPAAYSFTLSPMLEKKYFSNNPIVKWAQHPIEVLIAHRSVSGVERVTVALNRTYIIQNILL